MGGNPGLARINPQSKLGQNGPSPEGQEARYLIHGATGRLPRFPARAESDMWTLDIARGKRGNEKIAGLTPRSL